MKTLLFSVLIFICSQTYGAEAKEAPTEHTKLKGLMLQVFGKIQSLRKYMASPDEFNNPKNEAYIKNQLKDLAKLTKKADHQKLLNSPNFSFSRSVLQHHISEVERTFRVGNKDYARWMLNSTTNICMSCHTQLPQTTDVSKELNENSSPLGRSFSDAEFLFTTRRFKEALPLYMDFVSEYPKNKFKSSDLETSVRRVTAIHARVQRDPEVGYDDLQKMLKNDKLPEYLKSDIKAWSALFKKWQSEESIDPKTVKEAKLKEFVEDQFDRTLWDRMIPSGDPRVVTYLRVSGILYEYLNSHPKSELTPQILLWLAQCEYRLNNNFFYSLGDLYLKECIKSYSKNPIAKKCYEEYKDNVEMSYTGSRGTYIPPDVRRELNKLRKMVQ